MVDYKQHERTQAVTDILKAASDPTRRSLLMQICQEGPSRVTDLAQLHDMSLNAVSKHLKVLEQAGLIDRNRIGRTHWIEANLTGIHLIEEWVSNLKSIWALRLDKLNDILTTTPEEKDHERNRP